jgi:quercetin dioxygenase-like cupin family protein
MLGTLDRAGTIEDEAPGGGFVSRPTCHSRRAIRRSPVLLMAAGLVVAGIASLTLVHQSPAPGKTSAGTRPPVPVLASPDLTLAGPADVTVQMAGYDPGQSSGWHAHTGMHAVMVLSGTLTFYDGDCRRRTYGPGDTYVGGTEVHLAKNESATPVEMTVTYLFPAGLAHTTFHIPSTAPAGCDVT